MAYQPTEAGTRSPLSRRVGRDFSGFNGENATRDAATVAVNEFVSAVNAKVEPRRVTPRPGEAKLLASPLDAQVMLICDIESFLD